MNTIQLDLASFKCKLISSKVLQIWKIDRR